MSYRRQITGVLTAALAVAVGAATLGCAAGRGAASAGDADLHSYVEGVAQRIGPLTPLAEVFRAGQRLRAVPLACGAPLECPVALYADHERVGYLPGEAARVVDRALALRRTVSVRVIRVDDDDPVHGAQVEVAWRG